MLPLGMPTRRERTAPALDLSDPLGILQYFEDLEYLFEKHHISDGQDKKHAAVHYPSIQVARAWRCDDTFEDPAASFISFKVAIIALYPETAAALNPSFADLARLVAKRSHQSFRSQAELGEYYRDFRVISQSLIERGHISKGRQARLLFESFEPSLASTIRFRLQCAFPHQLPDDLYQTNDIYDAALYALALQFESVFIEPRPDIPSPLTLATTPASVPTTPPLPKPTVYALSPTAVASPANVSPNIPKPEASQARSQATNAKPFNTSSPLPNSNQDHVRENLGIVGTVSLSIEDIRNVAPGLRASKLYSISPSTPPSDPLPSRSSPSRSSPLVLAPIVSSPSSVSSVSLGPSAPNLYSELDSDISGRPSSKLDSDPLIPHGNVYIYISIKCGEGIQMTAPN